MNCLKCSHEFNIDKNLPRLLPHCGHTICEECVKKLISSNFILCPECKEVNLAATENDLPKNLAILSVKHELQKVIKKEDGYRNREDDKFCLDHLKEFDNFCFDCNEYGCIECLIDHQKQHKMKSLEQTHHYLRDHTQEMLKKTKDMKLSYRLQKIQIQKTELLSTVNNYKTEIYSLFLEMKNICERKEEDALGFLKSLYDIELIRLLEEQKEIKSLVQKYNKFQTINTSKTLKQLIDHYIDNKEIFTKNILDLNDNTKSRHQDKEKEKLVNEINRWESHFNKFKEGMMKQIKQIVNVKSVPVSSTIPIKLQVKTPRDQTRFYQSKTHTSLKQNKIQDIENLPPTKIMKVEVPSTANYASCKDTKPASTTLIYGGYTDESENVRMSGVEMYGSNKLYDKYVGCIGHVKFGIIEYNNQVYIFGGKVDSKRIDYIFGLPSLKQGFKILGKLSKPKSGFGYCRLEDSFVIAGGNDGDILSGCQEYSLDDFKTIKPISPLQIQRDQLSLTYHRGQIYAIGGYNSNSQISLKSVQVYSFETKQWEMISELTHPRRSHSSISLPSGLFVVGGYDGINYLSSVERLNEQTGTWDQIFNLTQPRCTFSISPHDQGFIVLGGFIKSPDKSCEVCNVKDMKCRVVGNLLCNRFMHGCITVGESFKG